jgi:Family of unknown function (DUF5991)
MNKLLIILMLSAAFALTANAQIANYVGSYEFSENGGKTAGGTAVFVGHDLTINADGSGKLTAAGYQTSKELFVKTKLVGSKLQILFVKYGEDQTVPTELKADTLLLTLEYKTVKKKKVLWTTFSGYAPVVFDAKKGGGIYFKKSKG